MATMSSEAARQASLRPSCKERHMARFEQATAAGELRARRSAMIWKWHRFLELDSAYSQGLSALGRIHHFQGVSSHC